MLSNCFHWFPRSGFQILPEWSFNCVTRARISSKNLLVRRTSGFTKPLVRNEIHLSDPKKIIKLNIYLMLRPNIGLRQLRCRLSSGQFHRDGRYILRGWESFQLPWFLESYPQEVVHLYKTCHWPCLFGATWKSVYRICMAWWWSEICAWRTLRQKDMGKK